MASPAADRARQAVALAGQKWRLRLTAWASQPESEAKRRALRAAVDALDEAIGQMFDAVQAEESRGRRRR